jgi:hypothetical protein
MSNLEVVLCGGPFDSIDGNRVTRKVGEATVRILRTIKMNHAVGGAIQVRLQLLQRINISGLHQFHRRRRGRLYEHAWQRVPCGRGVGG